MIVIYDKFTERVDEWRALGFKDLRAISMGVHVVNDKACFVWRWKHTRVVCVCL